MLFFEKDIDELIAIRLAEDIYIINKNFNKEKKDYIKRRIIEKYSKDWLVKTVIIYIWNKL